MKTNIHLMEWGQLLRQQIHQSITNGEWLIEFVVGLPRSISCLVNRSIGCSLINWFHEINSFHQLTSWRQFHSLCWSVVSWIKWNWIVFFSWRSHCRSSGHNPPIQRNSISFSSFTTPFLHWKLKFSYSGMGGKALQHSQFNQSAHSEELIEMNCWIVEWAAAVRQLAFISTNPIKFNSINSIKFHWFHYLIGLVEMSIAGRTYLLL